MLDPGPSPGLVPHFETHHQSWYFAIYITSKQVKTEATNWRRGRQTSDALHCNTGSLPTTDTARDVIFPVCTEARLLQNSRKDATSCSKCSAPHWSAHHVRIGVSVFKCCTVQLARHVFFLLILFECCAQCTPLCRWLNLLHVKWMMLGCHGGAWL